MSTTLTRTAPTSSVRRSINDLMAGLNRLGMTEPVVTGDERERLLLDHLDLKLQAERLELRHRLRLLDDEDHAELSDCLVRIERLHTRWSRPPD